MDSRLRGNDGGGAGMTEVGQERRGWGENHGGGVSFSAVSFTAQAQQQLSKRGETNQLTTQHGTKSPNPRSYKSTM